MEIEEFGNPCLSSTEPPSSFFYEPEDEEECPFETELRDIFENESVTGSDSNEDDEEEWESVSFEVKKDQPSTTTATTMKKKKQSKSLHQTPETTLTTTAEPAELSPSSMVMENDDHDHENEDEDEIKATASILLGKRRRGRPTREMVAARKKLINYAAANTNASKSLLSLLTSVIPTKKQKRHHHHHQNNDDNTSAIGKKKSFADNHQAMEDDGDDTTTPMAAPSKKTRSFITNQSVRGAHNRHTSKNCDITATPKDAEEGKVDGDSHPLKEYDNVEQNEGKLDTLMTTTTMLKPRKYKEKHSRVSRVGQDRQEKWLRVAKSKLPNIHDLLGESMICYFWCLEHDLKTKSRSTTTTTEPEIVETTSTSASPTTKQSQYQQKKHQLQQSKKDFEIDEDDYLVGNPNPDCQQCQNLVAIMNFDNSVLLYLDIMSASSQLQSGGSVKHTRPSDIAKYEHILNVSSVDDKNCMYMMIQFMAKTIGQSLQIPQVVTDSLLHDKSGDLALIINQFCTISGYVRIIVAWHFLLKLVVECMRLTVRPGYPVTSNVILQHLEAMRKNGEWCNAELQTNLFAAHQRSSSNNPTVPRQTQQMQRGKDRSEYSSSSSSRPATTHLQQYEHMKNWEIYYKQFENALRQVKDLVPVLAKKPCLQEEKNDDNVNEEEEEEEDVQLEKSQIETIQHRVNASLHGALERLHPYLKLTPRTATMATSLHQALLFLKARLDSSTSSIMYQYDKSSVRQDIREQCNLYVKCVKETHVPLFQEQKNQNLHLAKMGNYLQHLRPGFFQVNISPVCGAFLREQYLNREKRPYLPSGNYTRKRIQDLQKRKIVFIPGQTGYKLISS